MKKIILLFSVLFCSTTLFANTTINNIIFFGDSLTDDGNFYKASLHFMPSSPYYNGRFSNGPIWADDLASDLQQKYGISHDNFAVGGTTTIFRGNVPKYKILPYDLGEEITLYHTETPGADRSRTLYIIWIGANDYTSVLDQSPDQLTTAVVNQIAADISTLMGYGARNFLVFDLPDISRSPRGFGSAPEMQQRYRDLALLNHIKIANMVFQLKQQNPGDYFGFMDTYGFMNDLLTNINTYNQQYHLNITNTTSPCWTGGYTPIGDEQNKKQTQIAELANKMSLNPVLKNARPKEFAEYVMNNADLETAYQVGQMWSFGGTQCSSPDSYIFWDSVHPTRVTHSLIAMHVEQYLQQTGVSFQR